MRKEYEPSRAREVTHSPAPLTGGEECETLAGHGGKCPLARQRQENKMIPNGLELQLNDYGLEFDSFLGALYLPWRTIIVFGLVILALRVRKIIKARKAGN